MEQSIYNIVVDTAPNEHTIYNTLKRCLVVLDDEAFGTYLQCEGPHLQDLADAGILVDSAAYEQEVQEKAFDHDRFTNDWFALCLCPTYECNYKCPYCYEHGNNPSGIMTRDVMEATYRFFEKVYERDHFKSFSLEWYGGEPTLCMDIIEEMTNWFRKFCDEHGIEMNIGILSNCGMIDEKLAKRMADIGFENLMPTIDGCEELHNKRRVNKSQTNSFQKTLEGAHNCREYGIEVCANMNTDKINFSEFRELRQKLHDEEGIDIYPSLLKDYRQDFNHNDTGFDSNSFDLYTREEYAWDIHELFEETPYSKDVLQGMFRPVRNFCRGQLENYYVIDPFGDVYKCEGWLGQKEHMVFSLFDLPDDDARFTDYNPLRDPLCRDCEVLPLCKGQCAWDRALLDHACHIAKFTMGAYVKDYRSCYGDVQGSVTVLEKPVDFVSELNERFVCDGPNESRWAGIPWYDTDDDGNAVYSKGKFWHDKMEAAEELG
ncbi:MAG: radical SAM protein [Coriobacteriales bacterium]|jgi:uncharacterized protein